MELLQLRYFATVARMENISRAAVYHGIPQPYMSKVVSRIERELGVPLFARSKNRLTLTTEGCAFYQEVKKGLNSIDQAIQAVHESKSGIELTGEIKCLFLQHRYNLVNCIAAFQQIHPKARFSIFHTMRDATDYDLCVSSCSPAGPEDIGIPLLEEKLMVAVSKQHPLAGRQSVSLEDLRREKFLFLSPDSSILKILTIHCEEYGFHPHVAIYVDDLRCIEKYVACNFGIAIVPTASWRKLPFHGSALLPVDEAGFQRRTFLFCNNLHPINRTASAFFDYLQQNFSSLLEKADIAEQLSEFCEQGTQII